MIELRLPVGSRARPDDPDPESVRLVQETRERRASGLTTRERLASLLVGGGFLVAAAVFAVTAPNDRSPGWATALALVAAYAIAARVEFEIAEGVVVPTELILVPMLFLLPIGIVPLVVAAAIVLGRLPDYVRGRDPVQRIGLGLVSSWHALGPALVLAAAGAPAPSLSHWALYLAALGAQFVFDFASVTFHELIAHGVTPRAETKFMAVAYGVDAALAPLGLLAAMAAEADALSFLLVVPLLALLAVFAHQRRAAIDSAAALSSAYRGAAELLVDLVEDADEYTSDHSKQVVDLALEVADELGVDARGRRHAELAALLHDVGKMRPRFRGLVTKPSALTADERILIEEHTIEGQDMLDRFGGMLGDVGMIVRSCHERWDGKGYPDGLAGEQIPLVARIVSCVDAYNAMTTDRPYRNALRSEDALAELRVHAGTQFDPLVVEALDRVLARDQVAAAG